jgi:hypothetical protein
MRKGWGTFFVLLIPAILLSWALFIAVGTLLSRVCLERSPMAIAGLQAIPFLLPPALYFLIDRALLRTFLMLVAVALPLAIAIPGMEGAPQRSKQKETARRMQAIMTAIENNAARTNKYPDAASIDDLQRQLGQPLPKVDAWCHPFAVAARASGYLIVSFGLDGKPDGKPYVYGKADRLEDDIVAKDGTFLRSP